MPLSRETVAALRKAIAERPAPKEEGDDDLVFITKFGKRWFKETSDNPISKECGKLLEQLKIKRPGLNFYGLRHTFETVGGNSKDQVAVDAIMGHAEDSDDMSAVYREGVEDDRLLAVVNHVHRWLFPPKKNKPRRKAK